MGLIDDREGMLVQRMGREEAVMQRLDSGEPYPRRICGSPLERGRFRGATTNHAHPRWIEAKVKEHAACLQEQGAAIHDKEAARALVATDIAAVYHPASNGRRTNPRLATARGQICEDRAVALHKERIGIVE